MLFEKFKYYSYILDQIEVYLKQEKLNWLISSKLINYFLFEMFDFQEVNEKYETKFIARKRIILYFYLNNTVTIIY